MENQESVPLPLQVDLEHQIETQSLQKYYGFPIAAVRLDSSTI
jgi:hypothetical protein